MKKHKDHWNKLTKSQILKIFTGLTIIGLTATTLFISAAGTVVLYLYSPDPSAEVNETLTVSVRVKSQSETIGYVKAYLNFPTDKLSVVSISESGSSFGTKIEQAFNNTNGTIQIQRSGTKASGDRLIVKVVFKAKKAGSATVTYSSASDAKTSRTADEDKLTSTSSGTYTITGGSSTIPPPVPPPAPSPLPSAPSPPSPAPPAAPVAASAPRKNPAPPASSPIPLQTQPEPVATAPEEEVPVMEQQEFIDKDNSDVQAASNTNSLVKSDDSKIPLGLLAGAVFILAAIAMLTILIRHAVNARALAAHTAIPGNNAPPAQASGPPTIGPVVKPGVYVPTENHAQAPVVYAEPDLPPEPVVFKEIDPLKPDGQPKDMFEMAEERFEQDNRMKEFREDNPPEPKNRR